MALNKDYIPLRDAASLTGYHPDYLSALIRQGRLTGQKVGKAWLVSVADLERYSGKTVKSASTVHIVGVACAALFVVVGIFVLWNYMVVSHGEATPRADVLEAEHSTAVEIK